MSYIESTMLLSIVSIFLKRKCLAGAPRLPSEPVQTHPHPTGWSRGPVCFPVCLLTPHRAAPAVKQKDPLHSLELRGSPQGHFGEAFHIPCDPAAVVSEAADNYNFSVFTFLLPQSFCFEAQPGEQTSLSCLRIFARPPKALK